MQSLRVLVTPLPLLPPQSALVAFRDAAAEWRRPRQALLLSLALHVLFLVMPLPEFLTRPPARPSALNTVRIEYDLRWMGTSQTLPPISPTPQPEREPIPGGEEQKSLPAPSAEAVDAQTIVSNPPEPNHPTQTLLQQFALESARVRAPALQLPNMVFPPTSAPANKVNLSRLRVPGAPVQLTAPSQAAMPPPPKSAAELALESTQLENLLPRLTLPDSTGQEGTAAAPEVNAPVGTPRSGEVEMPGLVALSANPVAPTPVLVLPEGNLRARFAVGSLAGNGSPGGVPGGAEGSSDGGLGGEAGGPGGLSAPDILVTPAGSAPSGPVIVGVGAGARSPALPPASQPVAPAPESQSVASAQETPHKSAEERAQELLEGIRPGTPPGEGSPWRRSYTIYINMPNLTSQTGSWVLRFAELGNNSSAAAGGAADNYPLSAPVPIKKVDPGYPAAARRRGVEGTVSLYAIIRQDGTVDSVQVVGSLHALVDQSALAAFQRWRFEPGHKNGTAVPLEVVVQIPFRLNKLF